MFKRKFRGITKNFRISQEKIDSMRIQMTPTNAEFNGQFNDSRLKIQIEPKNRRTKETKKTFGRENLEELQKIFGFQKRKFT